MSTPIIPLENIITVVNVREGHYALIGSALPSMALDPRFAKESLQEALAAQYPGGRTPTPGATVNDDWDLLFPGDPPMTCGACIRRGTEVMILYPMDYVAFIRTDKPLSEAFMTRMD